MAHGVLQCEPLSGGVVVDLDAECDCWWEEADGRGRCERRGQRGHCEETASQFTASESDHVVVVNYCLVTNALLRRPGGLYSSG